MNKILVAGFEGTNNSAKILLDKILSTQNIEKLYLINDFEKCALQMTMYLKKYNYDLIIAYGQKPLIKSIYIEKYGVLYEKKYEQHSRLIT